MWNICTEIPVISKRHLIINLTKIMEFQNSSSPPDKSVFSTHIHIHWNRMLSSQTIKVCNLMFNTEEGNECVKKGNVDSTEGRTVHFIIR
jgi:hypothetical protein